MLSEIYGLMKVVNNQHKAETSVQKILLALKSFAETQAR